MNIILRVAAFLLLAVAVAPAYGQSPLGLTGVMSGGSKTDSAQRQATDDDLAELLRLLSNPALVEKLRQRSAETASQSTDGGISSSGVEKYFQEILSQIETRGSLIAQALLTVPQLSGALAAAWSESMAASEFLRSAIHIIIFLFGGFGLEWLYWSYLSGTLKRIELSKPESYGTILKAAMLRATLLLGSIAVFAFGSIGLFVAFEWSAFVEDIVISLLVGIILMRLIIMIGVFVLAPNVNDLRLLPLDKAAARNIYRWVLAVSGIGLLGVLVVDTIDRMAIAAPSLLAVEFIAASLVSLALVGALWRAKPAQHSSDASIEITAADVENPADETIPGPSTPGNFKLVLSSAVVVVAFLLWLADVPTLLWTMVAVALLIPTIRLAHVMVDHVFDDVEERTPDVVEAEDDEEGGEDGEHTHEPDPPNRYKLYRPIADRLIRFLLVILAALSIGAVWDVSSILDSASNSLAEKVFGVIIGPILAGAGVLGIALGFGAQALVKDIVSGVFS